jgi:hypothetical protein
MRQTMYLLIFAIIYVSNSFGQTFSDSIYNEWWTNKNNSIFHNVNSGQFLDQRQDIFNS